MADDASPNNGEMHYTNLPSIITFVQKNSSFERKQTVTETCQYRVEMCIPIHVLELMLRVFSIA
jgi:hypothetical protein